MSDLIEELRQNIRKLRADGENGFEGLIAAVLGELTQRSFVLASAGSQRGRDGQSTLDHETIVFEAKRYDDDIPKDKLFTKLFEISADDTSRIELYIIAATGSISAQHLTTLRNGAERLGIALVALQWPETGLAELATLLAMAPEVSAKFIAEHTSVRDAELADQLSAVRAHPQFQSRVAEIKATLQQPSIAPAFALKNNVAWLSAAFSDRNAARMLFGQALSPLDTSISGTIDRIHLRTKVASTVFGKPDGSVTAILGADGNGKSWVFAQAWSNQTTRPLTIVLIPDDVVAPPTTESCEELLISKLLTQTDDTRKSEARERWLRHFERWRKADQTAKPRLVVFMDGINQRESVDWLRFLDVTSDVVARLGGKLVFSCRSFFYRDNLKDRLVSRVVEIDVPEWSDPELDELLKERGTSIATLDPSIVRSLRNPRIFGVAAALFKAEEIKEFGELSVSRLLFEHIHSGSATLGLSLSPKKFAAEICAHAETIVQRLRQQGSDDTNANEFEIFPLLAAGRLNPNISEQFIITAAGRFFEPVGNSLNKYFLKDDGLPLALGLALVRAAREARWRKKSVDEALSNLIDPIAALDKTSNILLGAILAAVLEEDPQEIITPLIRFFVMAQNLNAALYPEFLNLYGRNPVAFLTALEEAALARGVVSNLSWLTEGANDLRGKEPFEAAIHSAIHRWLNTYSLAPERMIMLPDDTEHEKARAKQMAERESRLSADVAALSRSEHDLLASMSHERRGDYSELSLLAFHTIAGRPLAPFAKSLRNWCFAASLNGGLRDHHEVFDNLLHFNLTDWSTTRIALLEAAELLRAPDTSVTGQWALVYVLRATGDPNDAEEAAKIAEKLIEDREHGSWRLIEQYCATDPCDPKSEHPSNIDATAAKYIDIKSTEIRRVRSNSGDDLFYIMAQPGLARFRPDAAVKTLRAFAEQAVTRPHPEFRLAASILKNHTVGLEGRIAKPYVMKAREIAQAALDQGSDKNNEAWIAAQYALAIAFPHMTGDEQFDVLINHPNDKTVLIDLAYLFQPIDEVKLESELEKSTIKCNLVSQFRILCFYEYSDTPLTARAKELVINLLGSNDDHVRLSALALIQKTADPILLAGLVKSGWSATALDAASQKIEIFHGSNALVLAAEQGMISIEECIDRISLTAYERLAERLGADAARAVADRLNVAISKAAGFSVAGNLPDIEQNFEGRYFPVVHSVFEKRDQDEPLHESLRAAASADAWYERRKRNEEAAERFERDLTKSGAQLIIQSVTVGLIAEIDRAAPSLVDEWRMQFLKLNEKALNNVHNVAAVVAEALSSRNAPASLELFERLTRSSPHVRVTFGRDQLALNAVTVWGAADEKEMNAMRFARLDGINNDHALAMEILAAIRAERVHIIRDYVLDRRQRPEPAHRARAVMVAGLSPDEPWALETIDLLKAEHGFLGEAYHAAKYAMERYQWSRHWAARMGAATDPIELWRSFILLTKIVDGRFKPSDVDGGAPSPLIERFSTTLKDPMRHRISKWKGKRESTLFGMKVPSEIFIKH